MAPPRSISLCLFVHKRSDDRQPPSSGGWSLPEPPPPQTSPLARPPTVRRERSRWGRGVAARGTRLLCAPAATIANPACPLRAARPRVQAVAAAGPTAASGHCFTGFGVPSAERSNAPATRAGSGARGSRVHTHSPASNGSVSVPKGNQLQKSPRDPSPSAMCWEASPPPVVKCADRSSVYC